MTDFEKEEFWNALGRLYDETLELRKTSEALAVSVKGLLNIAQAHQVGGAEPPSDTL